MDHRRIRPKFRQTECTKRRKLDPAPSLPDTCLGFSLIETLVALVVLSVGLLAMIQALGNAFSLIARSDGYLDKGVLLWNQSQEVRNTGVGEEAVFVFSDSKPIFRSTLSTHPNGSENSWVVYETK